MRKSLLTGLIVGAATLPAWSVAAPPLTPPTPPATRPATTQPVAQPALPIPLTSLTEVQNTLERNTRWQQAADEALSRIKNDALRAQVKSRLEAVVPQVSHDLLAQPDAQAIVTIAIYKDPKSNRHALAAVMYEGTSTDLNPSFYPRLMADLPAAPRVAQRQEDLTLDQTATSYLCFFVDHENLDAGDIPHALMKRSLSMAAEKYLAKNQEAQVATGTMAGSSSTTTSQQEMDRRIAQARAERRAVDQADSARQNGSYYNNYNAYPPAPYSGGLYDGYYGRGYWSPWVVYVPSTGSPTVVEPRNPNASNKRPDVILPNAPAKRDPRTGQPEPPHPNGPVKNNIPLPAPREPNGQPAPPTPRSTQQPAPAAHREPEPARQPAPAQREEPRQAPPAQQQAPSKK